MKAKIIFVNFFKSIKHLMPQKLQLTIETFIILYMPIWLIRKLTIEFDGYLCNYIPKKGDVVLDCGAYKGYFSILASRLVGENGQVYAFEPQLLLYNNINEIIKKYNIKNIIPINKGLFSCKSVLAAEKGTFNAGFSIVEMEKKEINDPIIIDLIDLDSFVKEYDIKRLDFIKMDIEGAEIEALQGATNSLNNYSPNIAIASYHIREGKKTSIWVEGFLIQSGYKSWTSFPAHLTTYGHK